MNAIAFAAAQARYDALIPESVLDALERTEVAEWVEEGVASLLDRGDVVIPSAYGRAKVVATHPQLVRKLVDYMSGQLDQTCAVEQILIEIIKREDKGDRLYTLALEALGKVEGFDTPIHAIAIGLLEAHIEAFVKAEDDCLAVESRWE